jgi:hypothetical protein
MKIKSSKRRVGVWRSSVHNIPNLVDIKEYKKKIDEKELKEYLRGIDK